ncbi:hypothetical protein [Methanobrevibacter sp.]|uniref:hypothetical protein n=1 Tax=Methanobrevibacter sp. TaxID=66852 RepID=UPI0025CC8ECB|nr:hypothetical protein [Methanobrevibacter sp.]MBQ2666435.1 hypothetical protein [Methanobrevibacter sp.]
MLGNDFSDKIRITIKKTGESIELDQRRVRIREKENGLMALSYVAPAFEAMDLEDFFDGALSSEKLGMDIADTGEFTVSFRGIVDGKGTALPNNFEHRIILLQEVKFLDPRVNIQKTGFSRFKLRGEHPD